MFLFVLGPWLFFCTHVVSLEANETPLLMPIPQSNSSGYTVYQSLPVDFPDAGITGFVQILQDSRVTKEYRAGLGMSADPENSVGPDSQLLKSIKDAPLKNGRLRLVDRKGDVISTESIGEPLATIKLDHLHATMLPTFLVSVDYGIGMGSYAGPTTTLVEVRGGRLINFPVVFGQSLKSGWQIVPALNGDGKEIEVVQCHPNFKNPRWEDKNEFVVVYTTYRFTNGSWLPESSEKLGFWENDNGWPPRSAFP